MTFIQIFLLVNAVIIGGLITLALQHAYAHFRPHKEDKKAVVDHSAHLPAAVRDQLLADAQKKYQTMLDQAALELQKDLGETAGTLTDQLHKIGGKIVNDELEQYKNALRDMHVQADDAINGGRKDIEAYREEVKAKLNAEMASEKERLIAQIDTKLSDAVISFLIETLQHDVDLGAQSAYLTRMLEDHKDDFKKGVSDEN
ncbi:MAG: hypothetical protein ABIP50_01140 [Candidatus Saccharimonadales bacterium]